MRRKKKCRRIAVIIVLSAVLVGLHLYFYFREPHNSLTPSGIERRLTVSLTPNKEARFSGQIHRVENEVLMELIRTDTWKRFRSPESEKLLMKIKLEEEYYLSIYESYVEAYNEYVPLMAASRAYYLLPEEVIRQIHEFCSEKSN